MLKNINFKFFDVISVSPDSLLNGHLQALRYFSDLKLKTTRVILKIVINMIENCDRNSYNNI